MSRSGRCGLVLGMVGIVVAWWGPALAPAVAQEGESAASPGDVEPGSHDWSMQYAGLTRTYRVHLPPGYSPSGRPALILAFHGGGGRGRGIEKVSGLSEVSDREGFVVVYPDGVGRTWNDGRGLAAFPSMAQNIDDVGFVSALIDELAARLSIDVTRVYATGISNGGHFTHRLGVELSDKIAAIAPVEASMATSIAAEEPAYPVGVIQFFGTEDTHNYWQGGGRAGGQALSVPEVMAWWARHNGAADRPVVDFLPDSADDGTRIRTETWPTGRGGVQTVLYAIEGGGHTWAGGWQYMSEEEIGRTSRDINASEVMWEFFSAHRRDASAVAGGGRQPAGSSTDSTGSLDFGGVHRTYRLHVPVAVRSGGPAPLLVALHLGLADGATMEQISGFDALADREGVIVAYPDGLHERWAGPGLTTPPQLIGVDDVGFVMELIDRIESSLAVDRERVYVAGMCRGGFLAQQLAYEHPDEIAAVAAVTTFQTAEFTRRYSALRSPVPILIISSTVDPFVPFAGGPLPLTPQISVLSSRAVTDGWVGADGCTTPPAVTDEPDRADDGTRVHREDYSRCRGGAEVVYYAVEGGGHTWPGGWQYQPEQTIGRTSRDLDASALIWEFFSRHPRNGDAARVVR